MASIQNLKIFFYFIFTVTWWGEYFYHVTDDDIDVCQISDFPKSTYNLLLPWLYLPVSLI